MSTINLPQIVFWDKTHAEVQIGCTADYTTSFTRNKDGVLDKEGEYAIDKEILNTKYTDKIRICVGVAKCLMENGDIVGKRAETFDYSGKVILSMKEYLARRQCKMKCVRDLPVGANWVDNKREKLELYSNDVVRKMKGLRQTKLYILHKHGKITIDSLLSNNEDINGISEKLMRSLMTQSASAHVEEAQANLNVDQKLRENPYLSRYGIEWETEGTMKTRLRFYKSQTARPDLPYA